MKSDSFSPQPAATELLTVEQFAQRFQVSRATVFSWIQKQILVKGRHFIKIGRVLRFTWSDDLVSILMHDSALALPVAIPAIKPGCLTRKKSDSSLNWDY